MQYSIGQFADKTGLSPYTLRYYEKEGLLKPGRKLNQQRYYTAQDIDWVEFIKKLKETHMPLKEIKQYATLRAQGDHTFAARLALLKNHQEVLTATIQMWQSHLLLLNKKIIYYETHLDPAILTEVP